MEKKRKTSPPADRIIRSVVMPPDLDVKLQSMATAEQRSLSFLMVRAVREMVERAESGTARASSGKAG